MPNTSNLSVPYPAATDPAAVNVDIQNLATGIDAFFGAWNTYTPVWASSGTAPTLGNATLTGRYMKIGKLGHAVIVFIYGSTSAAGTGTYNFTLPAGWSIPVATGTAAAFGNGYGWASVDDVSATTRYIGTLIRNSSSTVGVATHAAATAFSGTVPVTLATGDLITLRVMTELT
jgi:hypothetical protein